MKIIGFFIILNVDLVHIKQYDRGKKNGQNLNEIVSAIQTCDISQKLTEIVISVHPYH